MACFQQVEQRLLLGHFQVQGWLIYKFVHIVDFLHVNLWIVEKSLRRGDASYMCTLLLFRDVDGTYFRSKPVSISRIDGLMCFSDDLVERERINFTAEEILLNQLRVEVTFSSLPVTWSFSTIVARRRKLDLDDVDGR